MRTPNPSDSVVLATEILRALVWATFFRELKVLLGSVVPDCAQLAVGSGARHYALQVGIQLIQLVVMGDFIFHYIRAIQPHGRRRPCVGG